MPLVSYFYELRGYICIARDVQFDRNPCGEEPGTGSDTDTIPYGVGDEENFDLPMF